MILTHNNHNLSMPVETSTKPTPASLADIESDYQARHGRLHELFALCFTAMVVTRLVSAACDVGLFGLMLIAIATTWVLSPFWATAFRWAILTPEAYRSYRNLSKQAKTSEETDDEDPS